MKIGISNYDNTKYIMFMHISERDTLKTITLDEVLSNHNDIFLISPQKHMLLVLNKSASRRHF